MACQLIFNKNIISRLCTLFKRMRRLGFIHPRPPLTSSFRNPNPNSSLWVVSPFWWFWLLLKEDETLERIMVLLDWSEDLFWASMNLCKCPSSLLYASMIVDLRFCPIFFFCDLVGREGFHKVGKFMDPRGLFKIMCCKSDVLLCMLFYAWVWSLFITLVDLN